MKNIIVATILFSLSTGLLHAMAPAGDDSVLGKRGPSDADWVNPAFLAAIDESVEDAFFDGPEVRAAVAKAEQEYASKRARPTVAAAAAARPPSVANIKVERLFGKEQHLRELISLIDGARQRVEIFSKTLEFLPKDLFQALKRAAFKGVQVTLTVQEVRNGRAADSLVEAGIQINDGRKTHTKFALADSKLAIIGSCNFLSLKELHQPVAADSSLKISGDNEFFDRARGRIYRDMICQEEGEASLPDRYCLDVIGNSKMHLLTNLHHHQVFFKHAIENARNKVVIYSPFINFVNTVSQLRVIREKLKPGVSVVIRVSKEHEARLFAALGKVPDLKPRVKISTGDFHRKSMMIDGESPNAILCEGSFNWLSASTDIASEHSNQETSIVLTGAAAQDLINGFLF